MFPRHPNAVFEGSTFTAYGKLEEIVRARYDGPAVILTCGGGQYRTTIGPNHPMMTNRGMVKAAELTKADKVLYDLGRENPDRAWLAGKYDSKQVVSVENIFQSCLSVGSDLTITTAGSNLHGDRVFCESEIEVIDSARSLLGVFDSCGIEKLRHNNFVGTNPNLISKPGLNSSQFSFDRVYLPSASSVSSPDNWILADDRFVWLDIHDISFGEFRGYAYDATTYSSLFCSDGFVVSNCRCTPIPANVGERLTGQKRGKSKIDAAIARSLKAEKGRRRAGLGALRRTSKWLGAGKHIAKKRATASVAAQTGKGGGSIIGDWVPPELREGITKEEKALINGLGKEVRDINRRIKAGTATQEDLLRLSEATKELSAAKKAAKDRITLEGKLGKKPEPKPKLPKPVVVEKSTPTDYSGKPSHITFTGQATDFSQRVWKEVGNGITTADHARSVGKVVQARAKELTNYELLTKSREELRELERVIDGVNIKIRNAPYTPITEPDSEYRQLWEERGKLEVRQLELKRIIAREKVQGYHQALREVRDFSSTELSFSGGGKYKPTFVKAAANLPDDWTNRIRDMLNLKPGGRRRGYFRLRGARPIGAGLRGNADIITSGYNEIQQLGTSTHELVHAMEATSSKFLELEGEFLRSRIKPGESPTRIYKKEYGYKDEFAEHYCGKYYGTLTNLDYTEVMTMGAGQGLVEGYDGILLDTDYMDFVLGMMAGF